MNIVGLIGRLTRDPELRYTPDGTAVCNFTIAVDRPFTNQNGDNEADFPQIVCWKGLAESVANHMRKGRLVGVEGRLQTRRYTNADDKTVWVTEVVAENVRFLDRAPEQQDQSNNGANTSNTNSRGSNGNNRRGNGSGARSSNRQNP